MVVGASQDLPNRQVSQGVSLGVKEEVLDTSQGLPTPVVITIIGGVLPRGSASPL